MGITAYLNFVFIGLVTLRKTFAYIGIYPVYIVDISLLFIYKINWKRFFLVVPFFLFGIFTILETEDLNLKALYPFLSIVYIIIIRSSGVASKALLVRLLRWYPLIFLIRLPLYYLGYIIYPGETFVLPLLFVFAIRLRLSHVILLSYLLCIFLTFERGTILNTFIASLFLVKRSSISLKSILRWVWLLIILLGTMPIVGQLLGNYYDLRIDFSIGEIVDFILSIFGLDNGSNESLSGTRNHRFEMWLLLIREMYVGGTSRFFLGVGFSGEILDLIGIGFRAPHNGYVSIFVRMGLVGLLCYITSLLGILKDLRLRESKVILLIYCMDMLVQTTIDSPFVPFMTAYLLNACEDGILFRS